MEQLSIFLKLIFFGFFLYVIQQFFVILFQSDIKIIAIFFASITAIAGNFITQSNIKKREQKNALRDKKIEIYNKFIDLVTRMTTPDNIETSLEKLEDKEKNDTLIKFQSEIILWGSPGVIATFLNFKKVLKEDPNKIMIATDSLYKEFRKDIGLSNYGLHNRELMKIRVLDPDEVDKL